VKKKRFSVEQIVGVLKQLEVGVPVAELIRQVGIRRADVVSLEETV
jgi:putative transposase